MSPSHVFEPTYQAIRSMVMAGHWPTGFRLEAGRLADDLGVSITPIRDSLSRLVGEKLVVLVPGTGYHVAPMSEQCLRNLLDLHLTLLLHALEAEPAGGILTDPDNLADNHAERSAGLFLRITALSGSMVLVEAIEALGARLHALRCREEEVLVKAAQELGALERAMTTPRNRGEQIALLRTYHTVRERHAAGLVALVQAGRPG